MKMHLTSIVLILMASAVAAETEIHGPRNSQPSRCYDEFRRPLRCFPEFMNAAFNMRVESTNTCGTRGPTEYCLQTGVTEPKKSCEICDASVPHLAHPPEYLTDFHSNDNQTWWSSETMFDGVQYPSQVNLTLHLGKAFDITYVRLKFYTSRPDSFAIYKRMSEEGEFIPYQYYSATCFDTYGVRNTNYVTNHNETKALCTSEYSDISPLTGGNVAFSTLEGRPSAYNIEDSPQMQEWVRATDIRITLDRVNTFGDEIFGDPKVLKSYYYAISEFAVGGRCKCHGHASECILSHNEQSPWKARRLVCRCEHNTAGVDCQECLPFYNDQPWASATASNVHECKACNCNGRSNKCYFHRQLWEQTGHGGHCIECRDNRDGANCERCKENFYQREDDRCVPCNCDPVGSRSLQCNNRGQCQCKPGVDGQRCNKCTANFYEFSDQGCRPCGCNTAGSIDNIPTCDHITGVCRSDCAELPMIPYTKLEKTSTTHGAYAVYVFQDPYKLIGHQRVQCLFGEWISRPRCNYTIHCSEPANPVNGRVSYSSVTYGSELRYECNPGFPLTNNVSRVCTADGEWSGKEPECIEANCEKPLPPDRGSVQFSNGQSVGSIATYTCEEGRTLVGASSSKCLENGVWTFEPPKCLRSCIIPEVENGVTGFYKTLEKYQETYTEFVQFQVGETVKHGVSVIVRCQAGFIPENLTTSLNGDADDVSCNNGILSKPIQCSANITCPMINTENSLIVVYTNDNKVNSRAKFHCNGDAKLIGENSAICMPIGQWSNPRPTCESIRRCALGEISSQAEPIKEYYLFGEQVALSCPKGKMLSSDVRIVMCLGTSWSDPIPDCVDAIYWRPRYRGNAEALK